MVDRVDTQKKEFDAIDRLSKCWNEIKQTMVDDDYPEVHDYYENAVTQFLEACRDNGRTIEPKYQYKGERPPQNELEREWWDRYGTVALHKLWAKREPSSQ